jgi:polar amino acid transport system permease protein
MVSLFDPALLVRYRAAIVAGASTTLLLGAFAVAASFLFGLAGWSLKTSRYRPLAWVGNAYVEALRNTPDLLYIYGLYFGLADMGLKLSAFLSAVLALGIQGGAYVAEIIRGAFTAVSNEQRLAARALGLKPWKSLRYVELPQMLRVAFPALGNQVISTLLGTALASVIAVPELTYQSQIMGDATYQYFSIFSVDAVIYLLLVQILSRLFHLIDHLWFGKWRGTV